MFGTRKEREKYHCENHIEVLLCYMSLKLKLPHLNPISLPVFEPIRSLSILYPALPSKNSSLDYSTRISHVYYVQIINMVVSTLVK